MVANQQKNKLSKMSCISGSLEKIVLEKTVQHKFPSSSPEHISLNLIQLIIFQ